MKRSSPVLFLVALVALILAACGGEERSVELQFWAFGSEGEQVKPLVEEFERLNPDIRVTLQQIPWTAAHEKLLTAIAGRTTPDVSQLGNTWIPEFAMLGALEPLDQWMNSSTAVDPADIFPGVMDPNIIDSTIFGLPWYVDTRVLYYRKDLLEKAGFAGPPRTWEELRLVCERMKRTSEPDQRYPIFLPTNEWVPSVVLGVQRGATLLKERNTRGDFRNPQFAEAFDFLLSFYRDQYSPVGMTQVTNLYHAFSQDFIAMYITGPWNIGEFRRRLPEGLQGSWMTAPLPTPDSIYPGASLALGTSLVVFTESERKDASWKLIEYLSSAPQQLSFYRLTGNLPVRKSVWQDSLLRSNIYVRAFYEQLHRVKSLPKIPEWEQIAIRVQLVSELAAAGALSAEETLSRLDYEVDGILEKRRWLVQKEGRE